MKINLRRRPVRQSSQFFGTGKFCSPEEIGGQTVGIASLPNESEPNHVTGNLTASADVVVAGDRGSRKNSRKRARETATHFLFRQKETVITAQPVGVQVIGRAGLPFPEETHFFPSLPVLAAIAAARTAGDLKSPGYDSRLQSEWDTYCLGGSMLFNLSTSFGERSIS